VLLQPVRLSRALVTNGEWLEFMADGGYTTPGLWLSDGWATVEAQGWDAPGYWRHVDGAWFSMTLGGLRAVDPAIAGVPRQLLRGGRISRAGPASICRAKPNGK
jgi:formylglycine-generating enzyme required for sulfatase activity